MDIRYMRENILGIVLVALAVIAFLVVVVAKYNLADEIGEIKSQQCKEVENE